MTLSTPQPSRLTPQQAWRMIEDLKAERVFHEADREKHSRLAEEYGEKARKTGEAIANLKDVYSAELGIDQPSTRRGRFETWDEYINAGWRIARPDLATPAELDKIMESNPISEALPRIERDAIKKAWNLVAIEQMASRIPGGRFNLKELLFSMCAVGMIETGPESARTTVTKHLRDSGRFRKDYAENGWWYYLGDQTAPVSGEEDEPGAGEVDSE